jgi:hypothetical protein
VERRAAPEQCRQTWLGARKKLLLSSANASGLLKLLASRVAGNRAVWQRRFGPRGLGGVLYARLTNDGYVACQVVSNQPITTAVPFALSPLAQSDVAKLRGELHPLADAFCLRASSAIEPGTSLAFHVPVIGYRLRLPLPFSRLQSRSAAPRDDRSSPPSQIPFRSSTTPAALQASGTLLW